MEFSQLFALADQIRRRAYAPYSGFKVGAALLNSEGQVFVGCNIENISFGLTCCAERVALFSAVATGRPEFVEIVIVADSREPVSPCGACRQVLAEFSPAMKVTCANLIGDIYSSTLADLLPRPKTGILDSSVPRGNNV